MPTFTLNQVVTFEILQGRKWVAGSGRVLPTGFDFRVIGRANGKRVQFDVSVDSNVRNLAAA